MVDDQSVVGIGPSGGLGDGWSWVGILVRGQMFSVR